MIEQEIIPSEETAIRIFGAHFGDGVNRVSRFPTGLCHYVYEIVTTGAKAYVVRIATQRTGEYIAGGLYWSPILRAAGVPLPLVHASGVDGPFPYMLLERLPGTDLGNVYAEMSSSQKRDLAIAVASAQQAVGALPEASGFGHAFSYEQANARNLSSWADLINTDVTRSSERIGAIGRIDMQFVERARSIVVKHESYLRGVRPIPFLDDMTTKNVIVDQGVLSGIVDTDEVCFGDPLFTVGLTKMALLSSGVDTDYIEYWLDAMDATHQEREIVILYSILFCLCFMSELGQTFNKHVEFSEERADHLIAIFEKLMNDAKA